MSILNITVDNFQHEVLESEKTVLLDFWAEWCGPCRAFSPTVDEVAEERTDVKVGKVNVDDQKELARKYRVMSIPTVVVIKGGDIVHRNVGAMSKEELLALLD